MTPKFVNADMFLDYWGEDLNELLPDNANPSAKCDTFLARVERRLMAWIDANTFRNIPYDSLTPFQLQEFRAALLEQAMYMWRNGDIGMDSGYDMEKGKIANRSDLKYIAVCQPALDALIKAGMFNQKMQNRRRTLHGWGATLGDYIAANDKAVVRPVNPDINETGD